MKLSLSNWTNGIKNIPAKKSEFEYITNNAGANKSEMVELSLLTLTPLQPHFELKTITP